MLISSSNYWGLVVGSILLAGVTWTVAIALIRRPSNLPQARIGRRSRPSITRIGLLMAIGAVGIASAVWLTMHDQRAVRISRAGEVLEVNPKFVLLGEPEHVDGPGDPLDQIYNATGETLVIDRECSIADPVHIAVPPGTVIRSSTYELFRRDYTERFTISLGAETDNCAARLTIR